MPAYRIIAHNFAVGGLIETSYYGHVVASKQALFLIKLPDNSLISAVVPFVASQITPFVKLFDIYAQKVEQDNVIECDLTELPTSITTDPGWPVKWPARIKPQKGLFRTIVIPSYAVRSMRYPWWGSLKVYTPDIKFRIKPSSFTRKSVILFLREVGYNIS